MRVMVIGASNNRNKFGNKAVRAYVRKRHEVLPVNPHCDEVEGLPCYHTPMDVPGKVDRALFYVPAQVGMSVIETLAQRGEVNEVWFNPGAESDELIAKAKSLGFEPVLDCAIVDIGERP